MFRSECIIRLQEVGVHHQSRRIVIESRIVPGDVDIIQFAVKFHLRPAVVEIIGGLIIGRETEFVEQPVIGESIAVADAHMQGKRTVSRIVVIP